MLAKGALCANAQLKGLDAAPSPGRSERKALMAEQRAWLQERDVFKADASCLEEEYQSRIQTLKGE